MALNIQRITAEEFEAFVNRPENADKLFELIGGDIVEVPSNPYTSFIAAIILTAFMNFVMPRKLGYVTGEAGGYIVQGERYALDVAFISRDRQPRLAREGYNPNPPDLAVEVISPTDKPHETTIKVGNFLAAGTVVWVVYPERQEVQVYIPGQAVQVRTTTDTLDGGAVLPGFSLPVADIFPEDD